MRPDLTEWEYEAWAKRYIIGIKFIYIKQVNNI